MIIFQSHIVLLVIFALCVSVVFATLMREQTAEQVMLGAKMFAGLVGAAIIVGWLMFPFPV